MIRMSGAATASMMRRACGGTRSTKNATPAFSPRASALAAPKKLEPTIRPRATSSAHSTGALKVERSTTEPMTTARSAASNTAATASVMLSSARTGARTPAVCGAAVMRRSDAGRFDLVDHRLGFRALLDEILGLHLNALAERALVAFGHRHALFLQDLESFLFDRHAVPAGIGRSP